MPNGVKWWIVSRCSLGVHLSFLAHLVALRHEYFLPAEPGLSLPRLHIAPHSSFPDGIIRVLAAQAHPDPMSRVPLLAWRFSSEASICSMCSLTGPTVRFPHHRFSLGRNRVPDRLPHHQTVHTMLFG